MSELDDQEAADEAVLAESRKHTRRSFAIAARRRGRRVGPVRVDRP